MDAKSTVYLETSVVSYLVARPSRDVIVLSHQQITWDWWQKKDDFFDIFISEAVIAEAEQGDSEAVQKRKEVLKAFQVLPLTKEVELLADEYLSAGVIPGNAIRDAIHMAVATLSEIDYLLTWNCRHLAGAVARSNIRTYNISKGLHYPIPATPEELMKE